MRIEILLDNFPFFRSMDAHMREVVRGASVAFFLKVVGTGLAFAFNILLARTLGAEGTGIYLLALTVTTIAVALGNMGLSNALLRFTASKASARDWTAVKGVYQKSMTMVLVASLVTSGTMMLTAPWLAFSLFSMPALVSPIRWMSLAVLPVVIYTLHAEGLKGLKRIGDSQFIQGVIVPAMSLFALWLIGGAYGVKGAVWAYNIAVATTVLIAYWIWNAATPHLKRRDGRFETRELLNSSMPLFWISIMTIVMNNASVVMLGFWGTEAEIGIFGIATHTARLTGFILISVNSIVAPKFAELYSKGDLSALKGLAGNTSKLMVLLASPILALYIFAPNVVLGIFGSQFTEGTVILAVLAVGQFINVATGSVGYLLIMSGNEHLMRNNIVCVAFLNVILNLVMIPFWGALGAAISNAATLSLMNIVCVYLVRKRLKIWPMPV